MRRWLPLLLASIRPLSDSAKELGNDNFDTLVQKGKDVWNEHLSKIEVEGGDLDQYRTFYSCFYRSLSFPRKFYEINAQGEDRTLQSV